MYNSKPPDETDCRSRDRRTFRLAKEHFSSVPHDTPEEKYVRRLLTKQTVEGTLRRHSIRWVIITQTSLTESTSTTSMSIRPRLKTYNGNLLLLLSLLALCQVVLFQQCSNLICAPQPMIDLAFFCLPHRRKFNYETLVSKNEQICVSSKESLALTLLTAQLGRIHSLAQHLDRHGTRLRQGTVLLIILLQQTLSTGIVGSRAGSFPAAIVAGRVAQVQLELSPRVPASVDE